MGRNHLVAKQRELAGPPPLPRVGLARATIFRQLHVRRVVTGGLKWSDSGELKAVRGPEFLRLFVSSWSPGEALG